MKNNFDSIAYLYDYLARWIIKERKLKEVQAAFLDCIHPNARVLIVGGGTGEILEWLPKGKHLSVDYVELSAKMLRRAKLRNAQETHFIQGDALEHSGLYDFIIAHFFLDCFDEDELPKMLKHLSSQLKVGGKLLVSDFCHNGKRKDEFLNKLMHLFLRLFANLSSKKLQNIRAVIRTSGLVETHYQTFDRGQLFSGVYEKQL